MDAVERYLTESKLGLICKTLTHLVLVYMATKVNPKNIQGDIL